MTSRPAVWAVLVAMAVAMAARGIACWQFAANLGDDRDAYLVLAQGLWAGRGYSQPGSTHPTAYRPPLYPLLLAPISRPDQAVWRGVLHSALGGAAASLAVWLAAVSGLPAARQAVAGLIVALDPLLVYYATLPMTESLATALAAGLLASSAAACKSSSPRVQRTCSLLAATFFGLCVLCRPTFWAFSILVMAFGLAQALRGRPPVALGAMRSRAGDWVLASILTGLIILPWCWRNLVALGQPVLTTTHGGYTLLLGNNAAYYQEVVRQPLGTVWDGSHGGGQAAWSAEVQKDLVAAGITGEIASDRWLHDRALDVIRSQPATFLLACVKRLLAFWSVRPHGGSAGQLPAAAETVMACAYLGLWLGCGWGLWTAWRRGGCAVELSTLMILAFVAVHLIYWTDARMRAPVMPALAVLTAWAGLDVRRRQSAMTDRTGSRVSAWDSAT